MATQKIKTAAKSKTKKTGKPAPAKTVKAAAAPAKRATTTVKAAQSKAAVKTAPKKAATKSRGAPAKSTAAKPAAAAQTVRARKAPITDVKTKTSSKPASTSTASPVMGIEPYKPAKGEEYMSDGMRDHFRRILLKWKQDLMEEVDRTVGHMKEDAANFADPADRATQEEEFSLELRTRDRERKLIKKIHEALDRLDANEFGYCEGCGVEIGLRRLEARPTADLCIDCKTLQEIKEKQMA